MHDLPAIKERLEEWKRLREKATKDEWWLLKERSVADGALTYSVLVGDQEDRVCEFHDGECSPEDNARFIIHAANHPPSSDMERLIAECERLEQYALGLRECLEEVEQCCDLKMKPHFSYGPQRVYKHIARALEDRTTENVWLDYKRVRHYAHLVCAVLSRNMVAKHDATAEEVEAAIQSLIDDRRKLQALTPNTGAAGE